jgi:hypothetical protein
LHRFEYYLQISYIYWNKKIKYFKVLGVAFGGRGWGAASPKHDTKKTRPQTFDSEPFEDGFGDATEDGLNIL